uniref:BED-type domain-containing protein n=1 Tax=Panagrellus redivivus TaxID=6233 RepID=A0A7E4VY00_PANRE
MSRLDFMQKSSTLTPFGTPGIVEDNASDCKAVDLSSGNESEPAFSLHYMCKFCSFTASETPDAISKHLTTIKATVIKLLRLQITANFINQP